MISVWLINTFQIKTIDGEIKINKNLYIRHHYRVFIRYRLGYNRSLSRSNFAQIGTGATVIILTVISAIAGTWLYGLVRHKNSTLIKYTTTMHHNEQDFITSILKMSTVIDYFIDNYRWFCLSMLDMANVLPKVLMILIIKLQISTTRCKGKK